MLFLVLLHTLPLGGPPWSSYHGYFVRKHSQWMFWWLIPPKLNFQKLQPVYSGSVSSVLPEYIGLSVGSVVGREASSCRKGGDSFCARVRLGNQARPHC